MASSHVSHRHALAFGKRVRRLRTAQGLSQDRFAAKAKLERAHIGKIERGEVEVKLFTIIRLARVLRVKPNELFTDWR